MQTVTFEASTVIKFKAIFDTWYAATLPTTVNFIQRGHLKSEWIVFFTP